MCRCPCTILHLCCMTFPLSQRYGSLISVSWFYCFCVSIPVSHIPAPRSNVSLVRFLGCDQRGFTTKGEFLRPYSITLLTSFVQISSLRPMLGILLRYIFAQDPDVLTCRPRCVLNHASPNCEVDLLRNGTKSAWNVAAAMMSWAEKHEARGEGSSVHYRPH